MAGTLRPTPHVDSPFLYSLEDFTIRQEQSSRFILHFQRHLIAVSRIPSHRTKSHLKNTMLALPAEITTTCLMRSWKTVAVSGIKVFPLGIHGCTYIFLPVVMSAASQILMLLEGLVFSWYWLILVWNKEHWPNPTSPIPSHFVNYLYWSIEGPKSISVANEQNLQEHISTSWAFGSNLRTSGTQTY